MVRTPMLRLCQRFSDRVLPLTQPYIFSSQGQPGERCGHLDPHPRRTARVGQAHWLAQGYHQAHQRMISSGVSLYSTRVNEDEQKELSIPQEIPSNFPNVLSGEQLLNDTLIINYGAHEVKKALKDLFDINEDEAIRMFTSKAAGPVHYEEVLKTLYTLRDHHIPSKQLQRVPWVLTHTAESLQTKLIKLQEPHLFLSSSDGLGFCHFSMKQISTIQQTFISEAQRFPSHPNRMYYLAEKLKVSVSHLTDTVIKRRSLFFNEMEHLEKMIAIFHKYGVSSEDVLSDPWVFGYRTEKAEARLQHATSLGCQPLKPWMCRCSDKIFENYCRRYQLDKKLLEGHRSITKYISQRLECNEEEVSTRFQSNLVLQKMRVMKFERVIDLLLDEGVTKRDIRSCMKVFQFSEERIRSRIKEAKAVGYFPFPMNILLYTPQKFKTIIKKYKIGEHQ